MRGGTQELTDLICRGITYIMYGVMVLLLEERYFERQNGEQFIDIAFDILDTILLPCPDLGRDIVIDRDICPTLYIFCNLQVETRIVHQDYTVRLPLGDIALAHLHITEDGWQM